MLRALEVIKVRGPRDAGRLVESARKTDGEVWVLDDAPHIALAVSMIDRIETDEHPKEPSVRLEVRFSQQLPAVGRTRSLIRC